MNNVPGFLIEFLGKSVKTGFLISFHLIGFLKTNFCPIHIQMYEKTSYFWCSKFCIQFLDSRLFDFYNKMKSYIVSIDVTIW